MAHLDFMITRLVALLALAVTLALPVRAGDSFVTPVTGTVLPGWQQADGSRMAALRLTLAPGWKTYWRTPGDAGIPPQFDWSASRNLRSVAIHWPTPGVFLTAGMRTIGYRDDLVLPLTLVPRKAGEPIRLETTLDIGVCSDICVPHKMTLKAVIDDTNGKPTPVIAAALASRPYAASEAGVRSATCKLRPTRDGMEIEALLSLPPTGGEEVVIIEPGGSGLWMSETKTSRSGNILRAVGEMMTGDGSPVAIRRSDIVITVLGSRQAVEIRGCTSG